MKDRKTFLIFLVPLLFYLLSAGGYLLWMRIVQAPSAPEQQIRDSCAIYRAEEHMVELNRATLEELLCIPGIGETKAHRILDYRDAHGGFRSVEELLEIQGIGEKQLELLKNYVWVEE